MPVGTVFRRSDAQAAAAVVQPRAKGAPRSWWSGPIRAEGRGGAFCRRARNFARRLEEASGLPVDLHGEALTSVEAEEGLRGAGLSASRRAAALDAEAAAVLLRDWLSPPGRPVPRVAERTGPRRARGHPSRFRAGVRALLAAVAVATVAAGGRPSPWARAPDSVQGVRRPLRPRSRSRPGPPRGDPRALERGGVVRDRRLLLPP